MIPAPVFEDRRPVLPALTGIRFFAALGPILWHAVNYADQTLPVAGQGYLGVDFFFMLSGFVLAYVHGEEMRQPSWAGYGRFLVLRLGRIWPAYIAALLAVVGIALSNGQLQLNDYSTPRLLLHALMMQNWGLIHAGEFNFPAWSVSAEWLVYLLLPVIAAILLRMPRKILLPAIPALIGVLAVSLAIAGYLTVNVINLLGQIRAVLEFAVGFLAWRLFCDARVRRWPWRVIGTACVPALALLLAFAGSQTLGDFLFILLFVPLLLSLAFGQGPLARVCAWRPLVFLGEASYSIYLVHMLAMRKALGIWYGAGPDGDFVLYLFTVIGMSIVAGIALHLVVEWPCRIWVRRKLGYAVAAPARL